MPDVNLFMHLEKKERCIVCIVISFSFSKINKFTNRLGQNYFALRSRFFNCFKLALFPKSSIS